jgi:alpha-methylacyl-CoA racemase
VLELSGIGPGPFAAGLLGDMGADVVRIDRPGAPAPTPPRLDVLRRSRRSVALDLRSRDGVDALLALAEKADVVIEGYRPGVAERLGIGPEQCWERNPRLVYGRMTGWGQEGPLAQTAGHDLTYVAMTGALHAMGRRGEAPAIPLNLVGDFGGGSLYLVSGILAALWEAERSGKGQVVDAAIIDGVSSLIGLFHGMMAAGTWQDQRGVNILDSGAPWYDVYAASDGGYLAVGAIEPQFYAELMKALGLPADETTRNDPSVWPDLRAQIAAVFATRTRDEWAEVFSDSDACVAPVLTLLEAPDHPHMVARDSYVDVAGVRQPAPAPRFSRTPSAVNGAPSIPGRHTREVLVDWGVSDIESLLASGVAVQVSAR